MVAYACAVPPKPLATTVLHKAASQPFGTLYLICSQSNLLFAGASIVDIDSMMPSAEGTVALRRLLNDHMQAASYGDNYVGGKPCAACDNKKSNNLLGGLGLDIDLGLNVSSALCS